MPPPPPPEPCLPKDALLALLQLIGPLSPRSNDKCSTHQRANKKKQDVIPPLNELLYAQWGHCHVEASVNECIWTCTRAHMHKRLHACRGAGVWMVVNGHDRPGAGRTGPQGM